MQLCTTTPAPSWRPARGMTDAEFNELGGFLYKEFGLKMGPPKKAMLEARLAKRLKQLGLDSYGAYRDYLFSPQGREQEIRHLVDAATTNTTEFFRESKHFDLLVNTALPELMASGLRKVTIWSAGCSSGEEPYTLAMVLAEASRKLEGLNYDILATDICSKVLECAREAVYPEDRAEKIPPPLRRQYLLRSVCREEPKIRMAPEIRRQVRFGQLNLMLDFRLSRPVEVIFCRNVVIYFDRQTQLGLFGRFCRALAPGGFLFIGHSESLNGMGLPLVQVAPAMYRRL